MRNERKSLRRMVVVAVLAAVAWSWGGAPVTAGRGESGAEREAKVEARKGERAPLLALLPGGLVEGLEALGFPGFRSIGAPGGIGLDPNGAPETAQPPADSEGGIGLDPNG